MSTGQSVWQRVIRRRSGYRVPVKFCVVNPCPRAKPTPQSVKDRHPLWIWKQNQRRRKTVRSANSRNKKNAKGSSTASPRRLTKLSLARTFASANSPAPPWSSTTLRLGSPISAKVALKSSHFRSLLTNANTNRCLGEILHRNQQRTIDLPYLRGRRPRGHPQGLQSGRAELQPELRSETREFLEGMAHGSGIQ